MKIFKKIFRSNTSFDAFYGQYNVHVDVICCITFLIILFFLPKPIYYILTMWTFAPFGLISLLSGFSLNFKYLYQEDGRQQLKFEIKYAMDHMKFPMTWFSKNLLTAFFNICKPDPKPISDPYDFFFNPDLHD